MGKDSISRCELFNRLATIPAPPEANEFKAKTYAVIQGMEATDRPQGEWMWHGDEDICNCSECGFEIDATGCIEPMEYVGVFHFCPNCGARMKGAEDELVE